MLSGCCSFAVLLYCCSAATAEVEVTASPHSPQPFPFFQNSTPSHPASSQLANNSQQPAKPSTSDNRNPSEISLPLAEQWDNELNRHQKHKRNNKELIKNNLSLIVLWKFKKNFFHFVSFLLKSLLNLPQLELKRTNPHFTKSNTQKPYSCIVLFSSTSTHSTPFVTSQPPQP